MKRILCGLFVAFCLSSATVALAAERWMHIRVVDHGEDGEKVRINVPLTLAEKVLPTIKVDQLCNGKVKVKDHDFEQIDWRAVLEAVRTSQDNEYVTVESKHENVRVAKSGGFLLVKVRELPHHGKDSAKTEAKPGEEKAETVDIKVPFPVVNALLSGGKDELNVLAAVQALNQFGDVELVTVNDSQNFVRIWVDSSSTAD